MNKKIVDGYFYFVEHTLPGERERFKALAKGQSPEVLMVTCADSRIDPYLITGTKPGELFVCRNAGNFVPPIGDDSSGMAAAVEFGVRVLKVKEIIVCGHSDCGAMKALARPESTTELPAVRGWLQYGSAALAVAGCCGTGPLGEHDLKLLALENIVAQMNHLRTLPSVAAAMAAGTLELTGWYYDIGTGAVEYCTSSAPVFLPLTRQTAAVGD